MKKIRAAAVQMVSGTDWRGNTQKMKALVREAAQQGADWVVLPEYWPLMGRQDSDKLALAEPAGNGVFQTALSEAAAENGVLLFGGTIPLAADTPDKVRNSMLVFAADGRQMARYDKIHLFGYSGLGERYAEADTIQPGSSVPHLSADGWGVAQGVCYDLRFPEFFRAQAPFGALVLPAAFTYTTGKAHWHLLLRTRAVENQCYVVASAQGGEHESGRKTFGHSMIIDPWGEVLAELPQGEGVVCADLDPARLESVRTRLPALKHQVFKV